MKKEHPDWDKYSQHIYLTKDLYLRYIKNSYTSRVRKKKTQLKKMRKDLNGYINDK